MGQGYVGLPLAMAAVTAGHTVIGFEPAEERLLHLMNGKSYVDDVDDQALAGALLTGRYEPTRHPAELADYDVAVITVPTPLANGQPDLSFVENATRTLAAHLQAGALVVLESTTYPGTTRDIVVPILEKATGWTAGEDFHVGFSPERIDPGNPAWTFGNTPKIVSGLTRGCRDLAERFYAGITQCTVLAETLEEAELAKVFENTFRHVNIALVNELAQLAHVLGADVWRTLDLAGTKPFGFAKFLPGPGVGGHCLPVDPVYLTHHARTRHGHAVRLVELAQDINSVQPDYVVQRLQDGINQRHHLGMFGARILALGAAYKPGTADMRQSPALEVIRRLTAKGALVTVIDPSPMPNYVGITGSRVPDDLSHYDAVVLLTPHDEFDLQRVADGSAYVLDTRGVMPVAPHIERL
nr:nucleotide sugar dehydrogenase [Streptomyces sp. SID4950]